MEIEMFCRNCNKLQDGHWHTVARAEQVKHILVPRCAYCKSLNVVLSDNEEWNDEKDDDIYD